MQTPHGYGERWMSIEEWLARRADQRAIARPIEGLLTPASAEEILAQRRRRSGPGVSHHTNTVPRHRDTA